jgi:hypothetical protein
MEAKKIIYDSLKIQPNKDPHPKKNMELEQQGKIEQALLNVVLFRIGAAWSYWLASGFDREQLKRNVDYINRRHHLNLKSYPGIKIDNLLQHAHVCQIPHLMLPEVSAFAVESWIAAWDEVLSNPRLSIGRQFLIAALAYKKDPEKLSRIILGIPQEERFIFEYLIEGNHWDDSVVFDKCFFEN